MSIWRDRKKTRDGVQRRAVAIRHLLQTARHFFNWAIAEGSATRTPLKSPEGTALISIKATKGRRRRFQDREADRILPVASPYVSDFLTAMLETGCRARGTPHAAMVGGVRRSLRGAREQRPRTGNFGKCRSNPRFAPSSSDADLDPTARSCRPMPTQRGYAHERSRTQTKRTFHPRASSRAST